MTLPEKVRHLRKSLSLTQGQLADSIGLSTQTIRSIEAGRRKPSGKTLVALERFFNVRGEELDGEVEPGLVCDNPELMGAVAESIPALLNNLRLSIGASTADAQKLSFDILVEVRHVLGVTDSAHRTAAVELIHAAVAESSRFVDVCRASSHTLELPRLEKIRLSCAENYAEALMAAQEKLVGV